MIRIDYTCNGQLRTELVADHEAARKFMRERSAVTSFTTREVEYEPWLRSIVNAMANPPKVRGT